MAVRMAPRSLQAIGGVLGIVMVAWCVVLALRAPVLDVSLQAREGAGLSVSRSAPGGPPAGTRLFELGGVPLDGALAVEEPDTLGGWDAYNDFMSRQTQLAAALAPGALPALDGQGTLWTVQARERTLADLPMLFWVQVGVGLLCFLIAFGVWIYRQADPAARHFAVCGLGVGISACAAAVYSTRGLALDGTLIRVLSIFNHLGAKLFAAGLLMLLWHYPSTLSPRSPAWLVYGLFAIFWLSFILQILPLSLGSYTFELLMLTASFACAWGQWQRTRRRPLERAALKWYLFSVYLGTGCFTVAVIIPVLLGVPPLASQALMFPTFLFMFAGIALGITRYRLFELDRWWFGAWTWFAGGVAVVLLDLALVATLDLNQDGALAISLALLGWVYFPLRQALWRRLERRRHPDGQARLGSSLEHLAAAPDDAALPQRWREVLAAEFGAAQVHGEPGAAGAPAIVENGLGLSLPDGAEGRLRLRLPDGGGRLFDRSDEARAEVLVRMLGHVREAVRERERAVQSERARIRRDLHDDLGAKLLSLVYLSEGEARQIAREATRDMRAVLSALDTSPGPLHEAAQVWAEEARTRLAAAGRRLHWQVSPQAGARVLTPRQCSNLDRIVREAVTNSLKHERGTCLTVAFEATAEGLRLDVHGDGDAAPGALPLPASIVGRAADLGGCAAWLPEQPGWLRIDIPGAAHAPSLAAGRIG